MRRQKPEKAIVDLVLEATVEFSAFILACLKKISKRKFNCLGCPSAPMLVPILTSLKTLEPTPGLWELIRVLEV